MSIRFLIAFPSLLLLHLPTASNAAPCRMPVACSSEPCPPIALDAACFTRQQGTASDSQPGKGGFRADGAARYKPKDKPDDSVYRIYTDANQSPFGRWWSLSRPKTDSARYRRSNAICPEWNPSMNWIVACPLSALKDMTIEVGYTQSVAPPSCSTATYPSSNEIQIGLPAQTPWINTSLCRTAPMRW